MASALPTVDFSCWTQTGNMTPNCQKICANSIKDALVNFGCVLLKNHNIGDEMVGL